MSENKCFSPKLYLQDLARGCLDIGSKTFGLEAVSNIGSKINGLDLSRKWLKNFQARGCLENVSKHFRARPISKVFEHNRAVSPTRWRYQSQV
jgi:hypothetical protein